MLGESRNREVIWGECRDIGKPFVGGNTYRKNGKSSVRDGSVKSCCVPRQSDYARAKMSFRGIEKSESYFWWGVKKLESQLSGG